MKLLAFVVALVLAQQQNLGWVYVLDDDGPDDQPTQSDLSFMGFNKDNAEYAELMWSWDSTYFSGANSGDGCSLWDLNKNGLADFSLCASINTVGTANVIELTQTMLYDCVDSQELKCMIESQPGFNNVANHSEMYPTVSGTGTKLKSTCRIVIGAPDPFALLHDPTKTESVWNDTRAICKLYYSDLKQGTYPRGVVMPGDPQLLNVCSFTSGVPTSKAKDCVVTAGSGFLVINKWTNDAESCTTYTASGYACGGGNAEATCTLSQCSAGFVAVDWNFTYTGPQTKNVSVRGFGWSPLVTLYAGTYSVLEQAPPAGWVEIGFYCADGQLNKNAVIIKSGQTLVCYYINYHGTRAGFEQQYGPIGNGTFGNITLEDFTPNRTYAPTPVPVPTPACPALVDFFTACDSNDFLNNATCDDACLATAQAAQLALISSTAAAQSICLSVYNTQYGPFLDPTTMSLLAERVTSDPPQPICLNGVSSGSVTPTTVGQFQSSATSPVASALFALMCLFY